jgi:hypothetical protein
MDGVGLINVLTVSLRTTTFIALHTHPILVLVG